jgi:hypothetical protein
MATCSAETLLEAGKCFQCLTKKELQIVITQLLCEIQDANSGVRTVFDTYPAAPDDPTGAALSYPSGGGTLYQWDVGTQAWV